jgi:restriction system protein
MKKYYRLMLGRGSVHAEDCFSGGFVGTDFDLGVDLKGKLPDEWREFNKEYIPVLLKIEPGKSRISAGLACGTIWTVSKGMVVGDVILCPDGQGRYRVGEISGDYYFAPGEILHHRRPVNWSNKFILRSEMSQNLRNSAGSIGTVSNITSYHEEISSFIGGETDAQLTTSDPTIEDASEFAMESHLEDFLIANWSQTELGQEFNIFEDEEGLVGKQYQTDTGPMDILCISKDEKILLVVELKKGRASDMVVGQTLRYMGYVSDELAEPNQQVKGLIIALSDDKRLRRALGPLNGAIEFYRYEISFKLKKIV